ncbi:MAG: Histidine kinase [uncultured Sulfurovum sp.]|uniref:histidine kinase n=1 Tax=uncultured Sulfurovum sp. TaxID=269237 RepID=A0A6S6U1Z6_9BACT|nr:MAG: Histidine kinase [uncultured Sulfurovum sp.]
MTNTIVETLYSLSEKSLLSAIPFIIFLTIILYIQTGYIILIWVSILIIVLSIRFYYAYLFRININKYDQVIWCKLFVLLAVITATIFSSLGFIFIHYLNDYYQLFITASLLGYSASAVNSLSADYRLALLYLIIIIIPLFFSLLLQYTFQSIVVSVLPILFFIAQVVIIFKNHTQNKQIGLLLETNQKLLNENKQFIADMVHQIRSPLAVILANTSLIEIKTKENISYNLEQINSSISMLNNAYEDLSYLISHDTIEYKPMKINLAYFMEERMEFFQSILKSNYKYIESHLEENIMIVINDTELERLIDNNITNAIKYSSHKSIIKILIYKTPTNIILKFISQGKNIKKPSKIFDKNYTENNNEKRSLGLGLHMVKNICEKNNIHYTVHSEKNINIFTYTFEL